MKGVIIKKERETEEEWKEGRKGSKGRKANRRKRRDGGGKEGRKVLDNEKIRYLYSSD